MIAEWGRGTLGREATLTDWAHHRGHLVGTVSRTLWRWAHRLAGGDTPHGGIARAIVADLRADLGSDLDARLAAAARPDDAAAA